MAEKAFTVYQKVLTKAVLLCYVILAWSAVALIVYYFDEFESFMMVFEPRRESSRRIYDSVDGTGLNAILTLLIPLGLFSTATYLSIKLKNYKPQELTPLLKISEEGIWNPIFGLILWNEIWYFSTLRVMATGSESLVLKLHDGEREIKIDMSGLNSNLGEVRNQILKYNTNPNLQDAGHLTDDTRYDKYGNVLN